MLKSILSIGILLFSLSSLATVRGYAVTEDGGEHEPSGCTEVEDIPSSVQMESAYPQDSEGYLGFLMLEDGTQNEASVTQKKHFYNSEANCKKVLALFIQAQGYGEQQCLIENKDLKSALNLKPKYFKSTGKVEVGNREVHQTVVLKNGQQVTYSEGGCQHFSYSFSYKNAAAGLQKLAPKAQAELAIRLLKQTPTTAHGTDKKNILIKALKTAIKDGTIKDSFSLPCGDASCEIAASPEDEPNTLVLGYMFAL